MEEPTEVLVNVIVFETHRGVSNLKSAKGL
jgi:hypothetical protein